RDEPRLGADQALHGGREHPAAAGPCPLLRSRLGQPAQRRAAAARRRDLGRDDRLDRLGRLHAKRGAEAARLLADPFQPVGSRWVERISLTGVRKAYGREAAVHDLDLEVRPGEFLTILGPSGCGKTTTLRAIAGLEEPDD